MTNEIYDQYKIEFWNWFDSLDITIKKKFWYYSGDAAFLYFYNKIVSKGLIDGKRMVC